MFKKFTSQALFSTLIAAAPLCADSIVTGVVNPGTCFAESKHGKKEQEGFELLRKEMASKVEETETQLKEIIAKFDDSEYMDSLSPKAEEELKAKYQALQEEMGRYQNQFYQVLNYAHHQMTQKVNQAIAVAAKNIAERNKLDYVVSKDLCFYVRPDLDVTSQVIVEMDKKFEIEARSKATNDSNEKSALELLELNSAN